MDPHTDGVIALGQQKGQGCLDTMGAGRSTRRTEMISSVLASLYLYTDLCTAPDQHHGQGVKHQATKDPSE